VEAHQSFVAAPAKLVEHHRDGGFAEAQHEAIGHRRGVGPIVVGQAGQAGTRALGGGWAPQRAQRRPGLIRYRQPPKEAPAGSGDGAARRHSVAARGGFAVATASALLPNDGLPLTNRPLRGLARRARIAAEPSVRRVPSALLVAGLPSNS